MLARITDEIPLARKLKAAYWERLTSRGRYLLWAMLALALLGLDTRGTQVYSLFAVAAALFLVACAFGLLSRPIVSVDFPLPSRVTALVPVRMRGRVGTPGGRASAGVWAGLDYHVSFPRPRKGQERFSASPRELFLKAGLDKPSEFDLDLLPLRRGRYAFGGPVVRRADPLHLALTQPAERSEQTLLVYPRFYSMEEFVVPVGRKYQPGGIPLASTTGDAIEFVGTREYREGDPIKNIHWRSWARRGEPVVKEYQEEYFCRIALILDTFLPASSGGQNPGGAGGVRTFESAVSVAASVADFFSRSEYIVDILAAGPDLYEVSAGRSLGYLENILDVLACLEPCFEPPFATIGPHLYEKLSQITTVIAVLLDWDSARENFLRRVKSEGAAVRVLLVHDGPTRAPWESAEEDLGEISRLAPGDVDRLLERPSPSGQRDR